MKIKSVLIIIATIIIGFIFGFFTNSYVTKNRIKNFVRMGTHEGYKIKLYHIIRPDDFQREKIEPIIDEFAEKNHELVFGFKSEMKELNIKLFKELEPYLDEGQKNRLRNVYRRFGKHPLDFPPPPPPERRRPGWQR